VESEGKGRARQLALVLLLSILPPGGALSTRAAGEAPKPPPAAPIFYTSLPAASEAAANDGALILLVFEASWCGPCHELQKKTLAKDFNERGGRLHVALVDVDANEKTARAFDVTAIPDLLLLTADGKIVARRKGFVAVEEFLTWLNEGRERAKKGLWAGVAPSDKMQEFVKKSKTASLSGDELRQLVPLLGEPDPGERTRAHTLLVAQREAAVPLLIDAVSDAYLGVRVGASEALRQLAPDSPEVDPWLAPLELQQTVAALKTWWTETGTLPVPATATASDTAVDLSLKNALAALLSNDPLRRTEGMSKLAGAGHAALPTVRDAIKRQERAGDQRATWLLEDVRWTILIPDSLDSRLGNVRRDLARGTSPERQSATTRLGRGGKEALAPLAELAEDPDPLVKECALRSLSSVGGSDVLPAMAALLKSSDSNLRMTAAQTLGKTKKTDAAQYLVTVLDDPNEVVACAAIAALEEVRAKDAGKALVRCLSDPRWRVRATAAEMIGKLRVSETASELTKALDDADGFVVKSALGALKELGTQPDTDKLRALAKRLPSLKSLVVEYLVANETEPSLQALMDLYEESSEDDRLVVLKTLAGRGRGRSGRSFVFHGSDSDSESAEKNKNAKWKPFLEKALASPEARIRREAASLLRERAPELAGQWITPLLRDNDAEVRIAAAAMTIDAANRHWAVRSDSELLTAEPSLRSPHAPTPPSSDAAEQDAPDAENKPKKSKREQKAEKQFAEWHPLLAQEAVKTTNLIVAIAAYATGDGKSDLPLLESSLAAEKFSSEGIRQACGAMSPMAVALKRLPWPEGKGVIDGLLKQPALFACSAATFQQASEPARAYLLDADRFVSALEAASAKDLQFALYSLLQSPATAGSLSLLAGTASTQKILERLIGSSKPVLRTAGVYGFVHSSATNSASFSEKALHDESPWVRRAAVQGIIRHTPDRKQREEKLAPFLADPEERIATLAALGLLEEEVLAASGKLDDVSYFRFEEIRTGSYSVSTSSDRPLSVVAEKPAFLEPVRRRLETLKEKDRELLSALTLLLAQYGDLSGLDRLVESLPEQTDDYEMLPQDILVGINLSKDPKYVPFLRNLAETARNDWSYREVLKALRGMEGSDARKLRVEVNKRIRKGAGNE